MVYIEQNKISPVVAQSLLLYGIAQAQRVFTEKNLVGKIVLSID
ncbi:hypothetical protein GMES_1525 [Paraglaciecola mesophila KMM 241]|uniref:Uncharacterized protein n=1 Tax=Paraglaciecola mesophila KMM 241 TaxID=1128912 RepID=K6YIM6_9ALTE|nr:hypothetical protein GMES_1525 [Paraglaciecola mesophila KMM 241]